MSSCQMSKSQTLRLWRRHIGNGEHGHNLGHMCNGKHGQRGIMVNTSDKMGHLGGWGTWVIGHMANRYMGNGEHGHNLGHMGNGKHGQRGIMVNTADRDGTPWGMGHMGDRAHGQ